MAVNIERIDRYIQAPAKAEKKEASEANRIDMIERVETQKTLFGRGGITEFERNPCFKKMGKHGNNSKSKKKSET